MRLVLILLKRRDLDQQLIAQSLWSRKVIVAHLLCKLLICPERGSADRSKPRRHQFIDHFLHHVKSFELGLQFFDLCVFRSPCSRRLLLLSLLLLLLGHLTLRLCGLVCLILLCLLLLALLQDILRNLTDPEFLLRKHFIHQCQTVLARKLSARAGAAEHRIGLIYVIRRCDIIALAASRALPHVERVILRPLKLDKSALLGYLFAV